MKKRLEGFKKLLESNQYLEEFDRTVFESIVDKIIVGGTNEDGEIDPAMITIIYKTGKKDSQDGQLFKSKRKNAKNTDEKNDNKLYPQSSNEVNNLYSYTADNTCGVHSVDTKSEIIKILHFKQFYKHYVFNEDGDGGRKKVLKNYIDVYVCIDMVCGDTRNELGSEE